MSDLATQKPNRSVRRQLTREQSKKERKEEKKLMKNAPDSVRFNSKKSRKVVPYSPIKAALIEKDTITAPKKRDALSDIFVPAAAAVTDKIPATTMVTATAAKVPEEASEVNASQEEQRKELPEEQKEDTFMLQQQEPPLLELASSLPPSQEEALKEIFHKSATYEEEEQLNAFSPPAVQETVSTSDTLESASANQVDNTKGDHHRPETKNEAIATTVHAPRSDDGDQIDKYDEAESESNFVTTTTTTTDDETHLADTNKEIKEEVQQIQQQQEPKKKEEEEEEEEEETMLPKDTTPAPSMTTSASISDKISPSTSTSSNTKRKSTLISRLFKHKNSSKKEINVAQESPLASGKDASSEKKKKPKAWKIWKKL
ncbi:hypothetical protein MBANPS3_010332 [Mucor bainieri]